VESDGSIVNINSKIRKTSPEPTLRRGMLISLLNKDISKFKEADQKKMKEYIETDGNLQNLYSAVNRFREILKGKDESRLEDWLSEVKRYNIRELNTFIMSVERDIEAVKNAIRTEFSNGIIEGVINKIKVIKRIMYGRCSFELLRLKAIMS
jgi:transposase